MKTAMNINDIPTNPVKFRSSKTMYITLHLYVNYLTGIFKKDLPNLVITETIGKVGVTTPLIQRVFHKITNELGGNSLVFVRRKLIEYQIDESIGKTWSNNCMYGNNFVFVYFSSIRVATNKTNGVNYYNNSSCATF